MFLRRNSRELRQSVEDVRGTGADLRWRTAASQPDHNESAI